MELKACWQQMTRKWDALQVELHGSYSVERMRGFKNYLDTTSSSMRVWAFMGLTPLSCLLAVIGPELTPLEPPETGLDHNHLFWVRFLIVHWIITYALLEQCRRFVGRLPMTVLEMALVSLIASIGGVSSGATTLVWWKHFVLNPELKKEVLFYGVVVGAQLKCAYVYPIYTFAFDKLSGWPQAAFALLLPVMKIMAKNGMSYLIRGQEDARPEFIIFNAEVFHALFAATCLQSSNSIATTVVIVVADFVHACLSLHDVNAIVEKIRGSVGDDRRDENDQPDG